MTASLVLISAVCGLAAAWVFRHATDRTAVRIVRKRVYARLLEFRLFADDPRLILRAQLALVAENARLVPLLLPAALISGIPLAWIVLQLDAVYGYRPLTVGQAATVTAQLDSGIESGDARSSLETPPGILVETPPVRDFEDRQISWRIRATRPACGLLKLTLRGHTIEKNISAEDGTVFLSHRRAHSLFQYLMHPEETRIQTPEVVWIAVDYPKTDAWIGWFLAVSAASALVFGRYA
jgi:hypothetical protein